MALQKVDNIQALNHAISQTKKPVVIGFFGDFSAISKKAKPEFEAFAKTQSDPMYCVDVMQVKNVHKSYGVTNVPTVILVENGRVLRKIHGTQNASHYQRALFPGNVSTDTKITDSKKRQKRVVVYVSDSCVWCTRVKNYLRKRQVTFREINLSQDPSAAQALRAKTGQQGVPQLDIEGQYIVGFDKSKIDRLLDLSPQG